MPIYYSELAARKRALESLRAGADTRTAAMNVLGAADIAGDHGWVEEFFTERSQDEKSELFLTLRAYGRNPDDGGSNALARDAVDTLLKWIDDWAEPTIREARADLRAEETSGGEYDEDRARELRATA